MGEKVFSTIFFQDKKIASIFFISTFFFFENRNFGNFGNRDFENFEISRENRDFEIFDFRNFRNFDFRNFDFRNCSKFQLDLQRISWICNASHGFATQIIFAIEHGLTPNAVLAAYIGEIANFDRFRTKTVKKPEKSRPPRNLFDNFWPNICFRDLQVMADTMQPTVFPTKVILGLICQLESDL